MKKGIDRSRNGREEHIANVLTEKFESPKDFIAFKWLALNMDEKDIEEAYELTLKKEQNEGFTHSKVQYFMGILRMKARQKGIRWFKKDYG